MLNDSSWHRRGRVRKYKSFKQSLSLQTECGTSTCSRVDSQHEKIDFGYENEMKTVPTGIVLPQSTSSLFLSPIHLKQIEALEVVSNTRSVI